MTDVVQLRIRWAEVQFNMVHPVVLYQYIII